MYRCILSAILDPPDHPRYHAKCSIVVHVVVVVVVVVCCVLLWSVVVYCIGRYLYASDKTNPPTIKGPTGCRPPDLSRALFNSCNAMYIYICCVIIIVFDRRTDSLVVADVLAPVWRQDIYNHHPGRDLSVRHWNIPTCPSANEATLGNMVK